jgi:hypothetical protein
MRRRRTGTGTKHGGWVGICMSIKNNSTSAPVSFETSQHDRSWIVAAAMVVSEFSVGKVYSTRIQKCCSTSTEAVIVVPSHRSVAKLSDHNDQQSGGHCFINRQKVFSRWACQTRRPWTCSVSDEWTLVGELGRGRGRDPCRRSVVAKHRVYQDSAFGFGPVRARS